MVIKKELEHLPTACALHKETVGIKAHLANVRADQVQKQHLDFIKRMASEIRRASAKGVFETTLSWSAKGCQSSDQVDIAVEALEMLKASLEELGYKAVLTKPEMTARMCGPTPTRGNYFVWVSWQEAS